MSRDRQISDQISHLEPHDPLEKPGPLSLRWANRADVLTLLRLKFLVARRPTSGDELNDIADIEWVRAALPDFLNETGPLAFHNYVIAVAGGVILGAACLNWFDRARRRHEARSISAPIEDQLLRLAPHSVLISDMAVFSRFRREGVASRLLAFAEEKARGFSTRRMALMVDSDNTPALALYEKCGFRRRAARPQSDGPSPKRHIASSRELILMTKTVPAEDDPQD